MGLSTGVGVMEGLELGIGIGDVRFSMGLFGGGCRLLGCFARN